MFIKACRIGPFHGHCGSGAVPRSQLFSPTAVFSVMNRLLCLHFLFLLPVSPLLAYDPLETGPAPSVEEFEITVSDSRTIPVHIFLPAEPVQAPVILFSHGLGGSRQGSNYLGQHWSSCGYVTVFLQHPGSDRSIWEGKKPMEIRRAMKAAASGEQFQNRISDVTATLDQLDAWNRENGHPLEGRFDLDHVGMSGHSFGAKTTQAVSGERFARLGRLTDFQDDRIDAALPMSPSPQERTDPEISFGQVELAWLLMTGTEDGAPGGIVSTTPEDRLKVYPALPHGDKYELVLDGAQHMAFTEREPRREEAERNPNHHRVILAVSTAFWDTYLKKDSDAEEWLKNDAPSVMEPGDRWQMK